MTGSRVAIAATFTAEPLLQPLEYLLGLLHGDVSINFAPFSQVFQTLLDPAGLFAGNAGGVNVVLLRGDDLTTNEALREFVEAVTASSAMHTAPLLIRVCPATPGVAVDSSPESQLHEQLKSDPRVTVLHSAEQDRLYPATEVHDPHAHALGAIPYTPEYFAALALHLARSLHRLQSAPYKVIALDCDDTLWSGVCGEDGPAGVTLDAPRLALQRFMAAQRDHGRLLTIASKNNAEDVAETFRAHPEMPLQPPLFAAARINWDHKAVSLQSLAQELNLGIDSFVFIDDNPRESAEVAAELPQVCALTLPADADRIPQFLEHVWALDPPRTVTAEDRNRSASYAQQSQRADWERQARSLEDFIAGLELNVAIESIREDEIPRVAQLTQRTNQMNFSTRRRSEIEVRRFLESGMGLSVHARDRFGDYGLVGVILLDDNVIDTFLLSCRALGRGVEHRMMRRVGELARERGLETVIANFESTARNAPAREFLASLEALAPFNFSTAALSALVYDPAKSLPRDTAPATPASAPSTRRTPDYQRIAELRHPSDLLAAVRVAKQSQAAHRAVSDLPSTPLEERLAAIWTELLGVPVIGVHDNFFDLGGHSLLAVQLVARLHRELAIDLPLEAVYTGTLTIAELARSIELFQLGKSVGQDDSDEYAALLAEIENLSDEEAEALLRRESF